MADIDFTATGAASSELVTHAQGKTMDAQQFDIDMAVRYTDHCAALHSLNGTEKHVVNAFTDTPALGVREMGKQFADNQALLKTVSTAEGKARVEGMIKDLASNHLWGSVCLSLDAIELRHLNTKP